MEDIIQFDNYLKKFKKKLIGPLNCSIKKARITALLGSSGSGKTVILNSLLGMIKNFNGKILVEGINRKSLKYFKVNKKIGYYTQMDFSLYNVSAYKFLLDISIMMGLNKKNVRMKIENWMKYFDLWEARNKSIKSFSWGMKNRMNLILCFIKDPEIIIMDEPGANLDSYWRNKIKNLLIEYKKQNKTVIITVHNIDEIADIIDDYIIIDNGENVFNGSAEELDIYAKYKVYINERFNHKNFRFFLSEYGIKAFKFDRDENSLVVAIENFKQINFLFLYLIKNNLPLKNLVKLPINMESIHKALESKKLMQS
ncbi:ATP-binding cassette domain-containing protein [Spiroplasma cantharicola]|uniref:ABC transporter ATP-binding protein n=1 Tax=Spiroplasma cantharicola TaxID=362837 RepID=A0A0M4JIS1_9MOLU|nr:ABC transporter ATP-binding protein [Spiroplasma cantharicola]ALD66553.1 ABC transporter ATP-binding protein [Spiroplasma cantharicola]